MRYFLQIAYNGKNYAGWQRQLNAISVQQKVEEALAAVLRNEIQTMGCGRTDAGVHASKFYLHFNSRARPEESFIRSMNGILPKDIAVYEIISVDKDAHARYDAVERGYRYKVIEQKSPFERDFAFKYNKFGLIDLDLLQASAGLLLQYNHFTPFCKTGSDAKSMKCQLHRSEWTEVDNGLEYFIHANRFLRGMVRLIVGMCLQVAVGELSLEQVKMALDEQSPLDKSWSVPARGLFLYRVKYPFLGNR